MSQRGHIVKPTGARKTWAIMYRDGDTNMRWEGKFNSRTDAQRRLTSVLAEIERPVVLDKSKKAVSANPLGTVAGLQFVLVFQSPEWGLCFQVALPAWLAWMKSIKINAPKIPVM